MVRVAERTQTICSRGAGLGVRLAKLDPKPKLPEAGQHPEKSAVAESRIEK